MASMTEVPVRAEVTVRVVDAHGAARRILNEDALLQAYRRDDQQHHLLLATVLAYLETANPDPARRDLMMCGLIARIREELARA